jgi:uncharacterized protein with PIN domain
MAINDKDVRALRDILDRCDNSEVNLVINLVKARRDAIARMNTATLGRGRRVKFKGRRGAMVTGTVEKVNRKTVIVKGDDNVTWRVAGSLLEVL